MCRARGNCLDSSSVAAWVIVNLIFSLAWAITSFYVLSFSLNLDSLSLCALTVDVDWLVDGEGIMLWDMTLMGGVGNMKSLIWDSA